MQVQAAVGRELEHCNRKQPAVCCNNDDVGFKGGQIGLRRLPSQAGWLEDRYFQPFSSLLDRRCIGLPSPSPGPVRRGDNGGNLDLRHIVELAQNGNDRRRRSHVDDFD